MGAPEDEIRYWKARAEELQAVVARLELRLLSLVRLLPLERLALLAADDAEIDSVLRSQELLDGWEETIRLTLSDVGTEMGLVWQRLGSGEEA